MNTYKIYKNGKEIDEMLMNAENEVEALSHWLDNNGFDGEYEMVEEDESGFYVEIEGVFYQIKDMNISFIESGVAKYE